jgi:SprT-like family
VDGEGQNDSSLTKELAMSKRTNWTDNRLKRLFVRYNQRYWGGKLPAYAVRLDSTYKGGYCCKKTHTITMNIESTQSDRDIRGVLLHEMAHAATRADHGATWRAEMARLRDAGAPTCAIDYRLDARLPDAFVIGQFEDAAWKPNADWETVLGALGYEYGYTDSHGNPRDAARARFIAKAHEAYKRARKKYLQSLTKNPSPLSAVNN